MYIFRFLLSCIIFGLFLVSTPTLVWASQTSQSSANEDESLYQQGIAYRNQKQYQKALESFQPLAEKGNVKAQHNAGMCHYHTGDKVGAYKWLKQAANQNFIPSINNLQKLKLQATDLIDEDTFSKPISATYSSTDDQRNGESPDASTTSVTLSKPQIAHFSIEGGPEYTLNGTHLKIAYLSSYGKRGSFILDFSGEAFHQCGGLTLKGPLSFSQALKIIQASGGLKELELKEVDLKREKEIEEKCTKYKSDVNSIATMDPEQGLIKAQEIQEYLEVADELALSDCSLQKSQIKGILIPLLYLRQYKAVPPKLVFSLMPGKDINEEQDAKISILTKALESLENTNLPTFPTENMVGMIGRIKWQTLMMLAKVYSDKEDIDKAITFSKKALDIFNLSFEFRRLLFDQSFGHSKKKALTKTFLATHLAVKATRTWSKIEKAVVSYSEECGNSAKQLLQNVASDCKEAKSNLAKLEQIEKRLKDALAGPKNTEPKILDLSIDFDLPFLEFEEFENYTFPE